MNILKHTLKITIILSLVSIMTVIGMHVVVAQEPDMEGAAILKKISPFFSTPTEFESKYGEFRSLLEFYDGRPVKTRENWQKRREEILTRWHEMMGAWPPLVENMEVEIIDTVHREKFTQYRIRFFWTPMEKTEGYLLIPDGKEKCPAVVTVYYEPETAIGLGNPNRDFAYQLAKRGFVTLSIGTAEASKTKTFSIYYPDIKNARVQPLSML
ncbi:MAG: sialidase, partial [Bacteroidota bacterium]|nr:sialidase [Bacteroidota bacterium]